MQILHGFRRILQATCLAVFFALFSINAFAYEIMPIFNWSAEIDGGTVSGVARCGPGSGSTSTSAKSWGSSNWNLQNKGCFCRARDIASVDWTDVPLEYASSTEAQRSYWYGSGGSNSMYPLNSLEECEANCADKCAALFASNSSYRNNLCGGDCQIDQGGTPVTTYTITYDLQGGTGCSNTTYNDTESATICEPTREGYTFDGWMDNNTYETYNGGDVVYNLNLNLVAFWTEIPGTRYTILYDTNGGTGCADTEYVNSTVLCTPNREAYHFDGWVDADTQNIYNGGITVSDIDLILTAQWTFVGCANGQYFENNACNTCVSGYTSDGATATSQNDCYRTCTTDDVDYSRGTVNGKYYYGGNNQCEPTDCVNGWHVNADELNLTSLISDNEVAAGWTANTSNGSEKYSTGMSNTIIANNPMEFAVDYGNKGIFNGHGRCSTRAGSSNTWGGNPRTYNVIDSNFVNNLTDETEQEGAQYCYCQLDSYTPVGYNVASLSAPWVFAYDLFNTGDCAEFCSYYCAAFMFGGSTEYSEFRAAVLESVSPLLSMCEIDTYTIVYNSNGGTVYENASYTIESDTITLPVPVRDGYEFDGWYDNADFYGYPITEITYGSTGDKEYHAKWIKLPCNNNYYGDGFICDTCPAAYPNSDNTDNNDITKCYAIVDYTNYCAPGASCYSVPSSKRYYYSSENPDAYIVKNLFTPSDTDDYTFGGWYLNDEYNGDEIINGSTLSGNLILYGKWDEILTTEWGCRVGKVNADADSWSEDIKEVGTDIPTAESLRSATGIVTRAGNDGSYILNYQDQQDYQTNLDRYLTGEEFYVTWGNTTIRGWAGCSANTWNTDKPNYSSQTLTYTNTGCGCSIDKERWIVKRNLLTQNGLTWDEKNEYCRANCPAACANAVANDYAFRTALFNGQCPEARQMYTITYHLNADNAHFENENNIPRTYTAESDSIALPIPQRDEYEFYGWYDNAELTGEAITTIVSGSTGDREYWAKWAQNPETYCNNQGTPYYWNGSTCVNAETECINHGQYFSWDDTNNICIYDEESECTDNGNVWNTDSCITHDEYCEANYGTDYVWNGESCEQAAFECTSGKWLHLGDNAKLCLSETKPASHESPVVLKVQVGNKVYYLSATPGADYLPVNEDSTGVKMKMYYKGRTYNVHDESISVF